MKVPNFEDDLSIISKLGVNPNSEDGLTADELQEKFDEASLIIQRFINEQIIPTLNNYVADSSGLLALIGGTMQGNINMDGKYKVTRLAAPSAGDDAATKSYVDTAGNKFLPNTGGSMNGALTMGAQIKMGGNKVTGVGSPVDPGDACSKQYTDSKVKESVNGAWKSVTGILKRNGWSGRQQSISCPGLTANSKVIASADGSNANGTRAWKESDVWAVSQTKGSLRFYYYEDAPQNDIPVIIFYEVGA